MSASTMNKEEVSKLAVPDPEFAKWISENPFPRADWSDMNKFRALRATMQNQKLAELGPPGPDIEETFRTITLRDGSKSELKIHKPTDKSKGPLFVLVFGGGFCVGDNQQLTPYARGLVKLFSATVINVSYRLAPEHKFPTAANDVWDSVLWIDKNVESLSVDPSKGFILGGVSAGGNLTAVTAQKAQDEGALKHPLTGLWLCVPLLFNTAENVPEKYRDLFFSREQNADAPIMNKENMDAIFNHWQPDPHSPLFSPFNTKTPHKGLPPSLVQVDGLDPLRDDGLIYEQALREHGVKTKLDIWPGLPHAHFSFVPHLAMTKKALVDTFLGFGWLLGTEITPQQIAGVMAAPGGG